ncbi:hypothetical protein GGI25_001488 [Coemansia spiralis]|uniref:Eukaryotic translation initiation factor 3 subunit M n=2 Tax=Coemansia TaxID=4863 RepID=A0A9W8KYH3_9FUNG|nr:hypothetical protein EDC05_001451 [Coemansia umbellata]KAJ2624471.1 hypothetical protein GGI26_001388 [Coemansia sp. RSA 1358]KAJ2679564.1 hypothetical protein GGI25_001488 [Coemansia spiralis]
MSARDVIFVDGEPSSQIRDLASFIGEQKQVSDLDAYVSSTNTAEAAVKESIGVLSKSPEEKLEAVYNQLFALVLIREEAPLDVVSVAKELAEDIAANVENGAAGLRVLNNLYNLVGDGKARALVFDSIVALAARSQLLGTVVPLISRLPAMFAEWGVGAGERARVLLDLRKALEAAQLTSEAYEAELVFLSAVGLEDQRAAEVASSAVVRFAKLSAVCDLDALASLDSVQELSKLDKLGDAGALLDALLASDYKQWRQFAANKRDMLTGLGVDIERASDKMRLLTVASLAAESLGQDVPFATVAQAIEVDEDEVEMWIIDVIRSGLIQGKMNQVSRTMLPTRTTYRRFGAEQWSILAERLEQWKQSLEKLQPVITNAKLVAQQQAVQMAGQARVTIKE